MLMSSAKNLWAIGKWILKFMSLIVNRKSYTNYRALWNAIRFNRSVKVKRRKKVKPRIITKNLLNFYRFFYLEINTTVKKATSYNFHSSYIPLRKIDFCVRNFYCSLFKISVQAAFHIPHLQAHAWLNFYFLTIKL